MEREPQFNLNGSSNIWIVKPACKYLYMQFYQEEEASNAFPSSRVFWTIP